MIRMVKTDKAFSVNITIFIGVEARHFKGSLLFGNGEFWRRNMWEVFVGCLKCVVNFPGFSRILGIQTDQRLFWVAAGGLG
jgi:hypothetical protein